MPHSTSRNVLTRLSIILAISLSSSVSLAQSLQAEQDKLTASNQQLQQLQTQQAQIEATLKSNKDALASLAGKEQPEDDTLASAKAELEQVQALYKTDPSAGNQAKLKNSEFKFALAERKYKKANSELFDLQQETDTLNAQLATTTAEIDALRSSIAQQSASVDTALTQQQTIEQQNLAQEQKRKAEADAAEIARLKAELLVKQKEETANKAAALAAAEAKTKADAAAAEQAAAQKAAVATAPVTQEVATITEKVSPATSANAATEANSGIVFLTTAAAVQAEEVRITELLAAPDAQQNSNYNKILNVKTLASDGTAGPATPNTLRPLGNNIYRGSANLKKGDTVFIVGFNSWRQQVNVSEETEFVFIFDSSNPAKPQLVYYPDSLAL